MNFDFDRFSKIAASVYTRESPYSLEDVLGVFKCYFQQYEAYTGYSHPPLRASQIARIIQDMPWLDCVCRGSVSADITPDCYPVIIEQHFKTRYRHCDYNINHFFSGKVRELRYYETCY